MAEDEEEEEQEEYPESEPPEDEQDGVHEDGTEGTMTLPPAAAATHDECVRLAQMLHKLLSALRDIADDPTQAVPPGLWPALHDAYLEMGDPDLIGSAIDNPPEFLSKLRDDRAIERAVKQMLAEGDNNVPLRQQLAQGGFTGNQLRLREATVNYANTEYVSHGRFTEVPKNDGVWAARVRGFLSKLFAVGSIVTDSLASLPDMTFMKVPSELLGLASEAAGMGN